MSLIREALEKARREGQRPPEAHSAPLRDRARIIDKSEKETPRPEPQYPQSPTTGPWRAHRRVERPSWPRTVAIAVTSVAASVVLTAWLVGRGDDLLLGGVGKEKDRVGKEVGALAAASSGSATAAPTPAASLAPGLNAVTAGPSLASAASTPSPAVPRDPSETAQARPTESRSPRNDRPSVASRPRSATAPPTPSLPSILSPPSPGRPALAAGGATAPPDPELHLDGIVASATNPVAVVNGRLLGLGESIEGYRITRIDGAEVELEKDGAKRILKLR
jgi:hypothetical protein